MPNKEKQMISVIMSSYNESLEYLKQSIDSIINQTYTNLEIIIVNDNPQREELDKFLLEYKNLDSRIIYTKNKKNEGLVYSLNKALSIASGDFVARMDADDVSELDRLEKQIIFLKENEYQLVGCYLTKIDERGNEIGEVRLPQKMEDILKYNRWGDCVMHPTWLCEKKVYDSLNGYREINSCEDYDFLLRAILQGYKLGNLPEKKLRYRIRTDSISALNNIEQQIMSYYLVDNYLRNKVVSLEELNTYIKSSEYINNSKKLQGYFDAKKDLIGNTRLKKKVKSLANIVFNKYFYRKLIERYMRFKRERC